MAGRIAAFVDTESQCGALICAFCETDFGSTRQAFKDFCNYIAQVSCELGVNSWDELMESTNSEIEVKRQEISDNINEVVLITAITVYKT